MGHKVTIRPNAKKLHKIFTNRHNMTWDEFSTKVRKYQTGFMGEPDEMKAGEGEFHENPTSCICRKKKANEQLKEDEHDSWPWEYSDIGNVPMATRSGLDHQSEFDHQN